MFGMSLAEIVLIGVLALIVFGPERIPKLARTVGGFIREMRRASAEVQRHLEIEDIRRELRERNAEVKSAFNDVTTAASSTLNAAAAPLPSNNARAIPSLPPPPSSLEDAPTTDDALASEDEAITESLRAYLAETQTTNHSSEDVVTASSPGAVALPRPGAPIGTIQHEEAS